ncbi:HAAS signaling domain-containing protein [Microbispora sp. H10949]|uniref:HAAS signaling domain-containing protein n=1 Tax=Microbispora sp. H10949 TaxID=2729111 RepID=UPI001600C017|nr:hypothetical protein [Microbispora sp. H10949]
MNSPLTPKAYADAVREALADLPPEDRETLLEDLHDHISEVAAEPGLSLEDRLGAPEAYAAELRAAYGGRPAGTATSRRGRLRSRTAGVARRAHTRMLGLPPYRQAAAFLPELRPAWWVLRGYAIALAVLATLTTPGLVPGDLVAWVFTLTVVWASVWLGRHARSGPRGWGRTLLAGANVLAVVLVITAMADASSTSPMNVSFDYGPGPAAVGPGRSVMIERAATLDGGPVYNILPYAADGTPLRDVRLYDQDGRPLTLRPEDFGQMLVIPCEGEPPLRNAYPLPLTPFDPRAARERDCAPNAAPNAASDSATAAPGPTATATPGPAVTATPGDGGEEATPTPEPSAASPAPSPTKPKPGRQGD